MLQAIPLQLSWELSYALLAVFCAVALDCAILETVHMHKNKNPGKDIPNVVQPCFSFIGSPFETDDKFKLAKSLILDAFRGDDVSRINLMLVTHLIVCSATDLRSIRWRHYAIHLKKSGTRVCAATGTVPHCSASPVAATQIIGMETQNILGARMVPEQVAQLAGAPSLIIHPFIGDIAPG
jgi:hypothetical protein